MVSQTDRDRDRIEEAKAEFGRELWAKAIAEFPEAWRGRFPSWFLSSAEDGLIGLSAEAKAGQRESARLQRDLRRTIGIGILTQEPEPHPEGWSEFCRLMIIGPDQYQAEFPEVVEEALLSQVLDGKRRVILVRPDGSTQELPREWARHSNACAYLRGQPHPEGELWIEPALSVPASEKRKHKAQAKWAKAEIEMETGLNKHGLDAPPRVIIGNYAEFREKFLPEGGGPDDDGTIRFHLRDVRERLKKKARGQE